MKFRLGPLDGSRLAHAQRGWQQVPVIDPRVVLTATIGVAVAMVMVLESFWRLRLGLGRGGLGIFVSSFVLMITLHEGLHACVLPGFPWSNRILMGLWPSRGFFVLYEGRMNRERWLMTAVLPFLILTLVPVGLALGFGIQSRFWADVATWNAAASCSDIVLFLLVLSEVPAGATIESRRDMTCWKTVASREQPPAGNGP